MKNIDQLIQEIKMQFIPEGIDKLILFGSYAYGVPREDSDIDLLVVTDEERIPENFSEMSALDIYFNRLIDHIRSQVPIDLIVHTRAMHNRFLQKNSLFSREIQNKGKIVYERS